MADERQENKAVALIVEDDDQIAMLLKFMVEREGMHVVAAHDGRAAREIIEVSAPPAIVLLDIMLPYVDGFTLVTVIRSKLEWQSVPVIMLSAKSQERDIVRALDAGANDYIVKPFKPEELKARIKRFVRSVR